MESQPELAEEPFIEKVRLAVCLGALIFMGYLYPFALKRVQKSAFRYSFNFWIIAAELVKFLLFFCYEIFYPHQDFLIVVLLFQTLIRSAVCLYFFKRALIVSNSSNQLRKFQTAFIAFALIFSGLILYTTFESQTNLNCNSGPFSTFLSTNPVGSQFYFLSGMDIVQSLVILVTSCLFVKHLQKQIRQQDETLSSLNRDTDFLRCQSSQAKVLSLTYLLFVDAEFFLQVFGNALWKEGQDYSCQGDKTIVSLNSMFSGYLLGYDLCVSLFSLLTVLVFYGIPAQRGFIRAELKEAPKTIVQKGEMMLVNERTVRKFLPQNDNYLDPQRVSYIDASSEVFLQTQGTKEKSAERPKIQQLEQEGPETVKKVVKKPQPVQKKKTVDLEVQEPKAKQVKEFEIDLQEVKSL